MSLFVCLFFDDHMCLKCIFPIFSHFQKTDRKPKKKSFADFVLGEKKIGGNAQAISGGRWLHHTSFLYDYKEDTMRLLKHPPKCPEYRKGREHADFVTKLRHVESDRSRFVKGIEMSIESNGFVPVPASLDVIQDAVQANTLVGTRVLYSPAGIHDI